MVCSFPAVHGACLASLPLLSCFGAGAMSGSPWCLPPWGEELDKPFMWLLCAISHGGNTLFLVIGILEIPIMNAVVFPSLPHLGINEFDCHLQPNSLPDIQSGSILSLVDCSVSCALECSGACPGLLLCVDVH